METVKFAKNSKGLSATTDALTLGSAKAGQVRRTTFIAVPTSGITAGKFKIEAAHDPSYSGTWAIVGSEVTLDTSGVPSVVQVDCPHMALRIRVSVAVTNGTVDFHAIGN